MGAAPMPPYPISARWQAAMNALPPPGQPAEGSAAPTSAMDSGPKYTTMSGIAKNAAAGAVEGAGDLLNVMSDPFGNLVGRPLATVGVLAHDLIVPHFGGKAFTPQERAELLDDGGDQIGTQAVNASARAVGATAPGQVAPQTGFEQGVRGVARMGTGAALLGPGEGAQALAGNFATGAAAYGGGQMADALVPESSKWHPTAELAGQIAGGAGMAGGEALARGGARLASDVARHVTEPLSIGPKVAAIDPTTGQPILDANGVPLMTTVGQQRVAARNVAQAAGRTPTDLAAALPPQDEATLVPGSTPTMGQLTGDTSLLGYERNLRNTVGRAAFTNAEAINTLARRAALEGLAPAEAGTAMREYVTSHLADLQRQAEENDATARQGATSTADQIGGAGQPSEYGQEMSEHVQRQFAPAFAASDHDLQAARGGVANALNAAGGNPATTDVQALGAGQQQGLDAMRQPVKAAASRLYEAIDPDGTLALDARPVGAAARDIQRNVGLGGAVSAAERAPLDAAAGIRGVIPFSDLRSLASNTSAALRAIRRDPQLGAESQSYRRISQLQDAIHGAMSEAASRRAEDDAEAIAAGTMRPEDGISARLGGTLDQEIDQRLSGEPSGTEAATGTWGNSGGENSPAPTTRQGTVPSGDGAEVPQARGPGNAPGDQGLSTPEGRGAPPAGNAGLAPAEGPFGPIHTTYRHDANEAISRLLADKTGEAVGALYHPQVGDIDLVWGKEGTPQKNYEDGYGLAKIAKKHPEVLNDLQSILSQMEVTRRTENRAQLESADHKGTVSLNWFEKPKKWLLTAYQKEAGEGSGTVSSIGTDNPKGSQGFPVNRSPSSVGSDATMDTATRPASDDTASRGADTSQNISQASAPNKGNAFQAIHGTTPESANVVARMPGATDLKANFDEAARTRLQQANVGYRDYKQRFREGTVGDVLQSGQGSTGFRLSPSAVPAKLFTPGPKGAEAADNLIRAAGSVEDAQGVLGEGPAHSLRLAAEQDGVLNTAKYQRWMAAHKPILDKFPALRAQFETLGKAQTTLDNALARRRDLDSQYPLAGVGSHAELAMRYWRPGERGGEGVQSYLRDTGSTPAALRTLDDYAAYSLRRDAFKNGEWNEAGYQSWQKRFAPALATRPELAQRFGTFADAQRTVGETAAADRARLNNFQDSAARFYLGRDGEGADLHAAVTRLMGADNPAREAADLMRRARGNDAAIDGIQRNVVDWMLEKARSTSESGTTGEKEIAGGAFQRALNNPKVRRALEQVLTPAQVRVMDAVGKDIERAARSVNATKVPGSPGTAADLHAMGTSDGVSLLLEAGLAEKAAEGLGHAAHLPGVAHVVPIIGPAAALWLKAKRAAGYAQIDQLATQMVLNPEFGRAMLQKAVPNSRAPIRRQALQRVVAAWMAAAAQGNGG
ncbi:hypothetical protein Gdia_2446 [Gluconacetobacter diazotrophicus PA1 5]|nr:hypothetical protein Gdia_2446 [Gluconacetobacter diazotrophicus PA1 5]